MCRRARLHRRRRLDGRSRCADSSRDRTRRCRRPSSRCSAAADSLRGYEPGHRAGDNLAAVSAEVRVPLNSPLSFGAFGVKGFIDAGTTWASGDAAGDQRFERGIGGGVYIGAAVFMLISTSRGRGREAAGALRVGSEFLNLYSSAKRKTQHFVSFESRVLPASSSVASLAALSAAVCA